MVETFLKEILLKFIGLGNGIKGLEFQEPARGIWHLH